MKARPTPACIVHIGTHKTGSTTIQQFLSANAGVLARFGILVPMSGRLAETSDGCGHHCIAWDLLGADPDAPVDGSLELLIEEIRTAGLPTVCISSEEFAHLYARPNNMQRLRAGLAGIGYRTVVVAYLRPQADYLEALYAEVAQHAPVRDFWACYREALKHGAADLWEAGVFAAPFDYDRHLLDPFRRIFGRRNVVVRPFRRFSAPNALVLDFIRVVAGTRFPVHELTLEPIPVRNARAGFAGVLAAIARNRDRSLPQDDRDSPTDVHFEVLRVHELVRLWWRFSRSNLLLLVRHGVHVGGVSRTRFLRALRQFVRSGHTNRRIELLRRVFEDDAGRITDGGAALN